MHSEHDSLNDVVRPARPVQVLIAEDTPVNQELLRTLLEPLGYQVAVVTNGRQAVSQVQRGLADIVLMDLQMPEMDGFQATRAIRALSSPQSAVPVIAVTSLTRQRDRDACRMAGVNDYLPKPVDKAKLLSVLEAWTSNAGEVPSRSAQERNQMSETDAIGQRISSMPDVMNLDVALQRMGNDRALLLQLAEFFLEDAPKLLEEIESARQTNELSTVCRAAHSLKGLAANFEALAAVAAARSVEEEGRYNRSDDLQSLLPVLQAEIHKLIEALAVEVAQSKAV